MLYNIFCIFIILYFIIVAYVFVVGMVYSIAGFWITEYSLHRTEKEWEEIRRKRNSKYTIKCKELKDINNKEELRLKI